LRAVRWARRRHEVGLLRHGGPSACAFIGATVGLLTLAVGCGGAGTAPTAEPGQRQQPSDRCHNPPRVVPTACQVLTGDVVTPVIGEDAKQTRDAQPNPNETQCQFTSSTAAINLMVGDWSVIKPIDSQEQTVSGIGDEAYISPLGLAVRKGSHRFALDASLAFGDFNGSAADSLQAKQDQAEKDLAPSGTWHRPAAGPPSDRCQPPYPLANRNRSGATVARQPPRQLLVTNVIGSAT
jgi:hypothetical protein